MRTVQSLAFQECAMLALADLVVPSTPPVWACSFLHRGWLSNVKPAMCSSRRKARHLQPASQHRNVDSGFCYAILHICRHTAVNMHIAHFGDIHKVA